MRERRDFYGFSTTVICSSNTHDRESDDRTRSRRLKKRILVSCIIEPGNMCARNEERLHPTGQGERGFFFRFTIALVYLSLSLMFCFKNTNAFRLSSDSIVQNK